MRVIAMGTNIDDSRELSAVGQDTDPVDQVPTVGVGFYAVVALLHWTQMLSLRHTVVWCAGVLTDPLDLLMNEIAPFVFLAFLIRSVHFRKVRGQWPRPGLFSTLFVGITLGLIVETEWLRQSGMPMRDVWWLPSIVSRAFLLVRW